MALMDPMERLANLIALLMEAPTPLTLEQIANELTDGYPDGTTARRTAFERDKHVLRSEGVPLRQVVLGGDDAGKTAYWIERSEFELADLGLAEDERRALQLAVAMVHLGSSWGEQAMWKLEHPDDEPVGPAVAVAASLPVADAVPTVQQAIRDRAPISFDYRESPRTLQPYGLLARDGFWYVIGHDVGAAQRRTYRLDRVQGSVKVGEGGQYDVPEGFRARDAFPADPKLLVDPAQADGEGLEDAKVAVDAPRAASVVNSLGPQAVVERRQDGSVVVQVPCRNVGAFRSWVLGLMEHAEVLSPPAARAAVEGWLTELVERGEDRPGSGRGRRAQR